MYWVVGGDTSLGFFVLSWAMVIEGRPTPCKPVDLSIGCGTGLFWCIDRVFHGFFLLCDGGFSAVECPKVDSGQSGIFHW